MSNNPWRTIALLLTCIWVLSFVMILDYEKEFREYSYSYESLLDDYHKLQKENEDIKKFEKDVFEVEMKKIDEYIAWKESLTAVHKASIPEIEITDEDRREFWKNYFICQLEKEGKNGDCSGD